MIRTMTRRFVAVAVSAAAAMTVGLTAPAQAALPSVNMEAVVMAAQIDPRRTGTGTTPGAKDSVLAVERALDAKNFLGASYVDGHFGTKTVEAYAAYQRSLGHTGLDATGLPGPTSLKTLGTNRFTVTQQITAGSRTTYHGKTVNTRTKAMLVEAERRLGRQVSITQGSYNAGGVGASAGTHDGGGALDLSVSNLSTTQRTATVKALRQVGFAAWLRTPSQGDWGYHVHAIAINDTDLSSGAQHQAGDYYLGKNGLANGAPDDGPQVTRVTWEEYQRSR